MGEFVSTQHVLSAAVIHPLAQSQAQRPAMFEEIHFIQRRHGCEGIAESQIANESRGGTLKDRTRRAVRVRFSRLFNCAKQRKRIVEL